MGFGGPANRASVCAVAWGVRGWEAEMHICTEKFEGLALRTRPNLCGDMGCRKLMLVSSVGVRVLSHAALGTK